ncbi:MAG: relaxase/mobilization nuclease domain-containing protein [Pseudomonadota bacterium]
MILVGNQRGGAKDLALHLLKDENEHVEVHELRGFASETLAEALSEAYAVSRGTRCKQFLFSLSLNPPPGENVRTEVFESAADRAEAKLGLSGQPRAIVFHEKEGRRHCHVVWSRINADAMKAVPLPYSKLKLKDVSRELYRENGWTMPHGLMNAKERDPRNFTLAEWQQAKRHGRDPREIKTTFQDCWAVSDTQVAFAHALNERGYILARGDRRGFVAIDHRGEAYAVSKWVGIRTKEVRAKLKDAKSLPSVDQARTQMARDMEANLTKLREQQDKALADRLAETRKQHAGLIHRQRGERQALSERHERRWQAETQARQARFNGGLRGLLDRVTGRRKQIQERNEHEAYAAFLRDRREKDALVFRHLDQRRALQEQFKSVRAASTERTQELRLDIAAYRDMKDGHRERLERLRSGKARTGRETRGRDFER